MDEMTIKRGQDPAAAGKLELKLSGSVTIAQAGELRDALKDALKDCSELRVDLTDITEIDLTGLQLLDSAHGSASSAGKHFGVECGNNQAFLETVAAAGFQRHVGCKKDTNGTCIWVGGHN